MQEPLPGVSRDSFMSPIFVPLTVSVSYMCDRTVPENLGAVEWGCVNMCQWSLQWERHAPLDTVHL